MIYADFEIILVSKDNGKQNPEEKDQKDSVCSYGYKLVCLDDRFSKLFNPNVGGQGVILPTVAFPLIT